ILIGAGMYEPGHALRTDTQTVGFKIGELDGRETARAKQLAEMLSDVAKAVVTPNLFGERWSKLAVNCMANPLGGLSGLGSAEIRSEPGPARIAVQVAAEAITVGRKCGFEVEPIYGIETQRFVDAAGGRDADRLLADMAAGAKKLAGGRPSRVQDVTAGGRTGIDYLTGFGVNEGRRVGVKPPFNEAVVRLVPQHGVGTLQPDPKNLEPLLQMLPH